jgi:hypothetical protein
MVTAKITNAKLASASAIAITDLFRRQLDASAFGLSATSIIRLIVML